MTDEYSADERCYSRAVEICNQLEAEFIPRMNAKSLVKLGLWRLPREIFLADLRVKLYCCASTGIEFDNWLFDYFQAICNVRLFPHAGPSYARIPLLQHPRDEVYTPDGPVPINNVDFEST